MELRVATLNIWNRMGDWDARLVAIREHLQKLAPDVIGLQEVLRIDVGGGEVFDQAALLADGLGYHVAYGRHPRGQMGNAILSRFPIVRTHVDPIPDGGTDERRSLVLAELDAPCGRIPFFCTHLNWKLDEGHVRESQVRFVTDRVAHAAPPDGTTFPPIVVGDFNAEPEADEIRFMRGLTSLGGKRVYFADCFGLEGAGPGTTFSRANPHAAPLREPNRRIDYVFVRGPDERGRGEPLAAEVCFDAPVGGAFPSDHFGVIARIAAP
ncbi:MAG: endonuclease/exonuclease/phosphatase family protein [Polyangiaceae bacterium]